MRRTETDFSNGRGPPSRRAVLKLGAGVAGAAVGVGGFAGSGAAWSRFDVDFRSEREVWILVGRDLDYDPPAVADVLVAADGEVTCHTIEFTRDRATTKPAHYGRTNVVPYEAGPGKTVLGVLPYNRPDEGHDRRERPRCVMPTDQADLSAVEATLDDAECVATATADHWQGTVKECWWDPLDAGDDDLSQREKLAPADGAGAAEFGHAVCLDDAGDTVLVGAPGAPDPSGEDGGAAYVFTRTGEGFVQTAKLAADDGQAGDRFGGAVALDAAGETALVGQGSGEGDSSERVYVFEHRDARWDQAAVVTPPDDTDATVSGFGQSVALDDAGETAMIGAPWSDDRGHDAGLVLVAERVDGSWGRPTVHRHAAGDSNDLGTAVALDGSGTSGVAGAPVPRTTEGEITGGYASVLRQTADGWQPTTRLTAEDARDFDGLGISVDCSNSGGVVIAGRTGPGIGVYGDRSGAVVFRRTPSDWVEVATLDHAGRANDVFGAAVALDDSGQVALVGAPGHDNLGGTDAGGAFLYAYDGGGWSRRSHAFADDASDDDRFGTALALDADAGTAAIGAPVAGKHETGAVYVFERGRSA